MTKEKYYICPNCGALNTENQILEEIGSGSCGMCYCEFDNGRILNKYKRINKKLWGNLNALKKDKLRLKEYIKYKLNKSKKGE
ncbi:MAG: hypothetical protein AABY10_04960 [Nanoarchaeota archaeon]